MVTKIEIPGAIQATTGDNLFQSEAEGKAVLTRLLSKTGLFMIHPETTGWMLHPRPLAKPQKVRADFILTPKRKLIDGGWDHGAIAIECKEPNRALGKVVCQCLDYSRSAFKLNPSGVMVIPEWTFIWHLENVIGDLQSVGTQNRIGQVYSRNGKLTFKGDGRNLIDIDADGELSSVKHSNAGQKAGSR